MHKTKSEIRGKLVCNLSCPCSCLNSFLSRIASVFSQAFVHTLARFDVLYNLEQRGFLIQDQFTAHAATMPIPYFTKRKDQLSAQEVDSSTRLSHVRIHVEGAGGRTLIFCSRSTVAGSHDVVTVCSCLRNLRESVVLKVKVD